MLLNRKPAAEESILEESIMHECEPDAKLNRVKSVMKAFLIMEELDKSGELSIRDLSERAHMDKATVHRLINTIKDAGYVDQDPSSKKYSNSLKLLAMGNRVVDKTGIKHICRKYIEELAAETGETVNLGMRVGNKIFYIDKLESSSTIKVGQNIGTNVPCYCSGLGKVILAFTEKDETMDILDGISFNKYTNHSITDRDLLMRELKEIKQKGYAVDDEEYVIGLVCIGAPILNYHGKPVAAISISCPKYRYDENLHLPLYSRLVMEEAQRISKRLGYNEAKKDESCS
ncbi:MAG: IclR family transcriptional regulator [Eubacteriales bacterium]|nr:IclR family transcriptional regulator [Eubacteriales bacterium]